MPETPTDPVLRRAAEHLTEEQLGHVLAMRRLGYHARLARILDIVQQLVAAVGQADAAHRALGIPDDAPLSEEEIALFASSQALLAQAASQHPGVQLLFPPLPEAHQSSEEG